MTATTTPMNYICTKNSDGSLRTFFIDHNEKTQFDSTIKSFIYSNDLNFRPGVLVRSSLEYAKVDNNLVIKLVKHPKITITFDSTMVCTYWSKHWLLERFLNICRRETICYYTLNILWIL